jgi:hypothetical protein
VPALAVPIEQSAPGDTHELPKQHAPPAQVEPAQQTLPGSPQREQTWVLALHAVPASVQTFPGQQLSPAPPQWTQVLPPQRVLGAVHRLPVQQGWPGPPQAPQDPPEHEPGTVRQLAPPATQVQPTQQPPPLHELPGQQGPPGVPQATPPSSLVPLPSRAPPSSAARPPPSAVLTDPSGLAGASGDWLPPLSTGAGAVVSLVLQLPQSATSKHRAPRCGTTCLTGGPPRGEAQDMAIGARRATILCLRVTHGASMMPRSP